MLSIQEFTLLYGDNERWCTWLSSLWSDPQVILLLEVYLWSTMFWSEDSPLIGACAGRSGGWADGGHCNYTIWKGQSTPPGSTEQAFWGTHTRSVCVHTHLHHSVCVNVNHARGKQWLIIRSPVLGKLKYIYDCTCHTTGVASRKLGGGKCVPVWLSVFVRGHHINFNKYCTHVCDNWLGSQYAWGLFLQLEVPSESRTFDTFSAVKLVGLRVSVSFSNPAHGPVPETLLVGMALARGDCTRVLLPRLEDMECGMQCTSGATTISRVFWPLLR